MEEIKQAMREIKGAISYINLSTMAFTYRLLFERHLPSMIQTKENLQEVIEMLDMTTFRTYDERRK